MFCSRAMNHKINNIHKRVLRLVYLEYTSSFNDLLRKDNSVTVHQRNIQLVAIEMFKFKRGIEIINNLFVFNYSNRGRSFHRPNVNSNFKGDNSITYFGRII